MATPAGVTVEIRLDNLPISESRKTLLKELRYNRPVVANYYPGDTVHGNIVVTRRNTQTNILSANILLSFQGKADVHIVTKRRFLFIPHGNLLRDSGDAIAYEGYTTIEPYFEENRINLASNVKIPMGESFYSFSFKLPENDIAPSFCGKHGDILYGMEGRLESLGFEDVITVVAFNVLGNVNVEDFPEAKSELVKAGEHYACCWKCCSGGPLRIEVRFPTGAYIPGDMVELFIEILNSSNRHVKKVFVQLRQKVLYIVGSVVEEEIKTVAEKLIPGFGSKKMEYRREKVLTVPNVQPTLEWGIIRITYNIRFIFDISKSNNFKLEVPVIIGSYRK